MSLRWTHLVTVHSLGVVWLRAYGGICTCRNLCLGVCGLHDVSGLQASATVLTQVVVTLIGDLPAPLLGPYWRYTTIPGKAHYLWGLSIEVWRRAQSVQLLHYVHRSCFVQYRKDKPSGLL